MVKLFNVCACAPTVVVYSALLIDTLCNSITHDVERPCTKYVRLYCAIPDLPVGIQIYNHACNIACIPPRTSPTDENPRLGQSLYFVTNNVCPPDFRLVKISIHNHVYT